MRLFPRPVAEDRLVRNLVLAGQEAGTESGHLAAPFTDVSGICFLMESRCTTASLGLGDTQMRVRVEIGLC